MNDDAHGGSIGLVGAVSIGIGGMVGGGIFAVLGVAATNAQGATPLAFLVGGVVAALTAYSYARLSVAHRSAGGTVAFVDRVFGVNALTGSLNILLWAGYVATTALYASAFGHYTATLFPGGTDPGAVLLRVLIVVGVLGPWVVNLTNASLVARSEDTIVGIKIAILVAVIVAGMPSITPSRLGPSSWPSPLGFIAAGMLIFVAYEGFELIANASDDVRAPERTLPRAFALSVGIVIVLYVLIAVVVVGSLTPDRIVQAADFALAEAASSSLGNVGFDLVAVSAMLATLSAINATLYGAARLSYTIATEGELPERFERLTWNQPVGLHLTAGLGALIAVVLPLSSISALASSVFLAVFLVVNAAAYRSADDIGARRWVAVAGAVGCAGSLVVLLGRSATEDPPALIALAAMAALSLGYEHLFLARRGRGSLSTAFQG